MEIVKTLIKVMLIAFVYLGVGPLLGFYLKGRASARRWVLGAMAFWLVRPPSDFTLMLNSIESYRGHSRGFEFNFMDAIAMAFIIAAVLEKRRDFKVLPPGLWAWFLWVGACSLSVVSAIEPVYALMPAFKFFKMGIIFLGVFAALQDEKDLRAMMRGFAVALVVQLVVCLWGRYVQGGFRVTGWFEHQNPMAMWSYMVAFPILGLAICQKTPRRDALFFFSAFTSAGVVVVLTVSRAALAAFVAGAVIIMLGSFLQGITRRRVVLSLLGAVGGLGVMAVAADTFMARVGEDSSPKNDLRYALNKQSAAMFLDHRWVGIGWNNYGLANSRPQGLKYSRVLEKWEESRGRRIYPENFRANPLTESLYWLILAENGIVGFLTLLGLVAITLWHGIRCTFAFWKSSLGLLVFGLTVALAITYFHGQVERVLTQTKNLTTWMMFCAALSRLEFWRRANRSRMKAGA